MNDMRGVWVLKRHGQVVAVMYFKDVPRVCPSRRGVGSARQADHPLAARRVQGRRHRGASHARSEGHSVGGGRSPSSIALRCGAAKQWTGATCGWAAASTCDSPDAGHVCQGFQTLRDAAMCVNRPACRRKLFWCGSGTCCAGAGPIDCHVGAPVVLAAVRKVRQRLLRMDMHTCPNDRAFIDDVAAPVSNRAWFSMLSDDMFSSSTFYSGAFNLFFELSTALFPFEEASQRRTTLRAGSTTRSKSAPEGRPV